MPVFYIPPMVQAKWYAEIHFAYSCNVGRSVGISPYSKDPCVCVWEWTCVLEDDIWHCGPFQSFELFCCGANRLTSRHETLISTVAFQEVLTLLQHLRFCSEEYYPIASLETTEKWPLDYVCEYFAKRLYCPLHHYPWLWEWMVCM